MLEFEYAADAGWHVDAMSCNCPQGYSPCTVDQVERDRDYWLNDVPPWSQRRHKFTHSIQRATGMLEQLKITLMLNQQARNLNA